MLKRQNVTILGATGTIGLHTLDVIARHPERFRAYALTAHSRVDAANFRTDGRGLKPVSSAQAAGNTRLAGRRFSRMDVFPHRVFRLLSGVNGALTASRHPACAYGPCGNA